MDTKKPQKQEPPQRAEHLLSTAKENTTALEKSNGTSIDCMKKIKLYL